MGRKAKFSFDTKMDIVMRCLSGKTTAKISRQAAVCIIRIFLVMDSPPVFYFMYRRFVHDKKTGHSACCILHLFHIKY